MVISPSLSMKSCRALNDPDWRGAWGSSWSFCNIWYTSESSMLVKVLELSRDSKKVLHQLSPRTLPYDLSKKNTSSRQHHLSGLWWTRPRIWPSMASWMLSEE